MAESSHRYVLIMAGGAGTRLWPLSRHAKPKHFQQITGSETLFEQMVRLSALVVPTERIFVMSVPRYHNLIREQAKNLPKENILSEPSLRDNGPAIALGLMKLRRIDPKAQVAVLWSDHLVQKPEVFAEALKAGFMAVEKSPTSVATIGANPTFPNTGFGYIQMGKEVGKYSGVPVFEAKSFKEKPDLATAKEYLKSWEYLWNVGYKIMDATYFFKTLDSVQPELTSVFANLEKAIDTDDRALLEKSYDALPKLSIEYLFTSYIKDMVVVPADMGWSDIGTWDILHFELQNGDKNGLVTKGPVNVVNSTNSLIYAKDRPVNVVGMDNVVVVDAGDTVLVLNKDKAQDIKQLIQELQEHNPELL